MTSSSSSNTNIGIENFNGTDFFYTKVSKKNYNNDNYISPQDTSIERQEGDNILIMKQKLSNRNYTHQSYGSMSYNKLQDIYLTNYHLFELLRDERKPYFDIEFVNDGNTDDIHKNIIKLIRNSLKSINVYVKDNEFKFYGSIGLGEKGLFKGLNKASYHIVIDNGYKFCSVKDVNKFSKYLKEQIIINKEYENLKFNNTFVIDMGVYTKNRVFKLPYQSKCYSKRIQYPIGDENPELKHYLISYGINDYKKIDVSNITLKYEKKVHKGASGRVFEGNKWDYNLIEEFLSCVEDVDYKNNIDGNVSYNVDYIVKSIYNGKCISFCIWFMVGSAIKRVCNDDKKGFNLFLEWTKKYNDNINERELKEEFSKFKNDRCGYKTLITLARLCNEKLDNYKPYENVFGDIDIQCNSVNKRYLDIEDFKSNKYNTIFIKSPMGTGKSENLKKIFEDNNYKTIIYLSPRRAFASAMYQEFKDYGFDNYLECKEFNDRIIISLESLQKCPLVNIDLLVIDESESIFNIISSETLIKNNFIYNLRDLQQYIKTSKKVLVMDAFLSGRSFDAINKIRNDNNSYYLKNQYQYDERKYYEVSKNAFIEDIKLSLQNNKKIVICCGSYTYGKFIMENIKQYNKNIAFYNSDNPLNLSVNVNDEWKDKDVILYTPTITCGISYDNPDFVFDKLYIYCVNKGSTHFRDTIQAHKRVRNFKDNTICICINDEFKGFNLDQQPTNQKEIKDLLIIYKKKLFSDELDSIKDNGYLLDWVLDVHTYNIMEKNINEIYLREIVYKYFELENITKIQKLSYEALLDKKLLEYNDKWVYNDIENIDGSKYRDIKYKLEFGKILDESDFQEYIKHLFNKEYNADDKEECFNQWFVGHKKKYFKNMRRFNKMLNIGFDEWKHENMTVENIEFYNMDILRYEHIKNILDTLGLIKNKKVDFNKEITTLDFEKLVSKYKAIDNKAVNMLFEDGYYKNKIEKGERKGQIKEFTTRSIKTITDKLLKENFGYCINSIGSYREKINGKRMMITKYKLETDVEKMKKRRRKCLWSNI
jgi:hypothetical protein